jgi:4-oxalocrotonate tautomerase
MDMPLVRIDLRKGKDATYRQEIGRVIYEAMVGVGVARTDDLVIIQITWNEGRTVEQKKTLYKAIAVGEVTGRPGGRRFH